MRFGAHLFDKFKNDSIKSKQKKIVACLLGMSRGGSRPAWARIILVKGGIEDSRSLKSPPPPPHKELYKRPLNCSHIV